MGQDKALLPFHERPLAVWMAELLRQVCDEVFLVGCPAKHSQLGFPVIADIRPNQGPLGGIHTALVHSEARFSLVVGCDMPYLSEKFLDWLLEIAAAADADAVVPESGEFGYEPLCAIYTRACLLPIEEALRADRRKISSFFESLRIRLVTRQEWQPYDPSGKLFRNLNTPEDYEQARMELLAGERSVRS